MAFILVAFRPGSDFGSNFHEARLPKILEILFATARGASCALKTHGKTEHAMA
jgi:hypothetical protein